MKKHWTIIGILLVVALASGAALEAVALAKANRQHREEVSGLRAGLLAARTQAEESQTELDSLRAELYQSGAQLADAAAALSKADANIRRLRRLYDGLYSSYQRLYSFASILVGSYRYQSSYNSISCTTHSIGGYTYTNCF